MASTVAAGRMLPDARARRQTKRQVRDELTFFLFTSPWLLGFALFSLYPIVASIVLSFARYDILTKPIPIGLENYRFMFADDPLVLKSLRVTAVFTFTSVPLTMIGALIVALLMNEKFHGVSVFRTIYYLPSVVTGVPVALLWMLIFRPTGVLNNLLSILGIPGPNWLFSEEWVMPALIIMSLWGLGGPMVIYLAGLQGIPESLYDAAQIDGAGSWHRFRYVTLPMLSPTVFFNLVMGIIGSFQTFTAGYIMTAGGPNNASLFFVLHLYRVGFKYYRMGYASALAWLLFVIILAFTLAILKTSPAWVYYEGMAERK